MTEITISKEDDGRHGRYVAKVAGISAEAELTFTHRGPGLISADHTGAPDELRGTGAAAALVEFLIDDARSSGFRIIPLCPYVRARYLNHLEWQEGNDRRPRRSPLHSERACIVIHLIGISGSLRSASFNTALLRTAAELMPAGATLDVHTLHGVPLYDADVEEADGIPGPVAALKEAIATADGVILGTPEYNNGIPGVFKNAIDWASRPPEDSARVFKDRPFAIIGASPGGFGTILSQNHWLPVLRTLGVDLWPGARLLVSHAGKVIGEDGKVIDQDTRDQIERFIAGFVSHVADRGSAKST